MSKFGDHGSVHDSPLNGGSFHEVLRHDTSITKSDYRERSRNNTLCPHDSIHKPPLRKEGSLEGSMPGTPTDFGSGHVSHLSCGAHFNSNAAGMDK
ncbi:unnamed protein product [Cuscuta campestris]|uniref:Uncharacterized protein n=1 Tax=Cuscuta campestris TaxID=132261 RepID=A0A484MNQ3_9ASTE|nr:unnamed protein product [Cuscuta campestris]